MGAHHAVYTNYSFHFGFLLDVRRSFRRCLLEIPQPQSVGHHEYAAQAHGSRSQHGRKGNAKGQIQHPRRNGNAQRVVEKCPEQVLPDIADGCPAQSDGIADGGEGIPHQHNVRRFHGDVCTGTNRHANIGSNQSGSIVDAVTHHEYPVTLLPQLLHRACLLCRQYIGNHL